jgi:tetratricopeptide (TPR) repeat protein
VKTLNRYADPPLLLLALALFALGLSARADDSPSGESAYLRLFKQANQSYQESDFDSARDSYEELLDLEISDASLLYNLGNTYIQLGLPGRAVWMYERALKLDPRNQDVAFNLRQIAPPENSSDPFILLVPFLAARDFLSLDEWSYIAGGIWLVLALLITLKNLLQSRAAGDAVKRASWPLAVLLVAALGMIFARSWTDQFSAQGIVLESSVSRYGPGDQFKEHIMLPAGRKVRILSSEGDGQWAQIAIPGQSKTYIPAEKVGRI